LEEVEQRQIQLDADKEKIFAGVLEALGGEVTEDVELPMDVQQAIGEHQEKRKQEGFEKYMRKQNAKRNAEHDEHRAKQDEKWARWEQRQASGDAGPAGGEACGGGGSDDDEVQVPATTHIDLRAPL
jgi:hypothetical protein